jgi:hypothetical protein
MVNGKWDGMILEVWCFIGELFKQPDEGGVSTLF